jgi:hypothetical protein
MCNFINCPPHARLQSSISRQPLEHPQLGEDYSPPSNAKAMNE